MFQQFVSRLRLRHKNSAWASGGPAGEGLWVGDEQLGRFKAERSIRRLYKHREKARTLHTNGPRNVLRCGALSFHKKPLKHAGCGRARSRNICFGHVLVAARQSQRRDAVATGEERDGRCAAEKSKYIRLYSYSVKLALVAMHLRRARVAGRSFAAGALKHVCTAGACGKKTRRGPPAALLGARVWRIAWGDGAHFPSRRHGAKYISLNHHVDFESFSDISNFRGLG
jgi:hypothetical protein